MLHLRQQYQQHHHHQAAGSSNPPGASPYAHRHEEGCAGVLQRRTLSLLISSVVARQRVEVDPAAADTHTADKGREVGGRLTSKQAAQEVCMSANKAPE